MVCCKHCYSEDVKVITSYKYYDIYECQDCGSWTYNIIETCCRDPHEIYVFEYDDHKPKFIRLQCVNCGGCLTMTKPFPFAEYSMIVEGEFSKERFKEWKSDKQAERNLIFNIAQHIKFTKTTFYRYNIYLLSQKWKALRREALTRDGYICQYCKETEATEVHHLSYNNLENESLDELISYCGDCHKKVHDKVKTVPTNNK